MSEARSSAATHPGARRSANQDACLARLDLGLWAIADGAGGHQAGADAAQAVVAALDAVPPGLAAAELLAQVRLRLAGVHAALGRAAAEAGGGTLMAATVVALVARAGHFACLWAGDARAYRLAGDGPPERLTRDHSVVAELVEAGALTEPEAATHPDASVVTRAIGDGSEAVALDKVIGAIRLGERFLLCSDGIWKALPDSDLASLLRDGASAAAIVEAALARDAADNITAVVVVMD
jgi:serine/threonine protein phosphatase PrpC